MINDCLIIGISGITIPDSVIKQFNNFDGEDRIGRVSIINIGNEMFEYDKQNDSRSMLQKSIKVKAIRVKLRSLTRNNDILILRYCKHISFIKRNCDVYYQTERGKIIKVLKDISKWVVTSMIQEDIENDKMVGMSTKDELVILIKIHDIYKGIKIVGGDNSDIFERLKILNDSVWDDIYKRNYIPYNNGLKNHYINPNTGIIRINKGGS